MKRSMFKKVPSQLNFPEIEHRVLKFWEKTKAFDTLREKNRGGKTFSFIDGPITANNPRGIGVTHAWQRTYKDIFQRYKAMLGLDQRFQNGFDTQGLWLEVEVERDLGLNAKKDILKYGLAAFAEKCRERVHVSADAVVRTSKRLGQWMDWANSYYTYTDSNIEHIWHFLKMCHQRGWLYVGHRVMPWCARCGTSLSQHELIDSYEEMTHMAVYLKLPLEGREKEYILVWTTTPWTLTANVALAVHPDLSYVRVRQGDEILYLFMGLTDRLEGDFEEVETVKGSELVGLRYEGPFDDLPAQKDVEHRVIAWDQVGADEGTGVVHIAPGCGAEDFELSEQEGLAVIAPIDEEGIYRENFGALSSKNVFEVNDLIFDDLKQKGYLYKLEQYTHRYPECWRCKEELVFRLVDEWFIACDEIRPKMIEAAQTVRWIPEHSGKRMEDWLNNMGDWCISRKRYWGLPLPFYRCSCGETTIVGSVEELRKWATDPEAVDSLQELHRPWIDAVKIRCPRCGAETERIPEIGDCWLDAGIVPFSTLNYLGEDRGMWEKWFPAGFITEMREQIRLWFYSQLFMSVTLEGVTPYRTVLTHEKVNDAEGEPMHKSLGNMIWFDEAVERMGADVMRWLYAGQNPSLNVSFGYEPAEEVRRKLLTLWNTYSFFVLYANLDGANPKGHDPPPSGRSVLDRWLLSRVNLVVRATRQEMDRYNVAAVMRLIEDLFEDLSNWYVRRSRPRFWKSKNDTDKAAAYLTLHEALVTVCKLMAPILPFLTEEIYQNLVRSIDPGAPESVHLCDYPQVREDLIDLELMDHMEVARKVVRLGRAARMSTQLKVRQPLARVLILLKDGRSMTGSIARLQSLIMDELNVKEVEVMDDLSSLVEYQVRPNFSLLGPRFGKLVPKVRDALEQMDSREVAAEVDKEMEIVLNVEGDPVMLSPKEVLVETHPREGLALAEESGYLVAVDTTLTEDLRDEGFAREFVHKVQTMRKEADFEVSDRIAISYWTTERLKQAILNFEEYIRSETLCLDLVEKDHDGDLSVSCLINGENAHIAIRRMAY